MSIQLPFPELLPESSWQMPDEFPDLIGRGAKRLIVDVESCDPHLKAKGPGFIRGDAFVAGVSIKTGDGLFKKYYPVRHLQGQNLAPNVVFPWLAEQLEGDQEKLGAHLLYDFEALQHEGITKIGGKWLDIQVAEPLLDEETSKGYSLEALALKYLGRGKEEDLLREIAPMYKSGFKGGKNSQKAIPFHPKSDIWKMPAKYVGAYAEGDVELPELIFAQQRKLISDEGLDKIFSLETRLIPILLKMRMNGVRVDLEKAHALAKLMTTEVDRISMEIIKLVGFDPNVDSGKDLAKAYNKLNISYLFTTAGNPSFPQDWLLKQDDPLSRIIVRKRKLMTMRDDFVVGDIIKEQVNGRVHAQFHQLRQDDHGTRSGRFSSTNPNLQQVPARFDEDFWGPESPVWPDEIRKLFLPDVGKRWLKGDISQQEPRLLVHYASVCNLPGADIAVAAFRKNPLTDYHTLTTEIVNRVSGKSFKRKQIKGVNLGVMYSMGLEKLRRMLGVNREEAKEILKDYHGALPFVLALSSKAMSTAQDRGYIITLLGRKRRFNLWEPVPESKEERETTRYQGLPREEAEARWKGRRLQRHGIHKALNALIQGSAGDQIKQAMVNLHEEHDIVAQLQVHDELDGSVDGPDEARIYKKEIQNCVILDIPVICEVALGESWGNAKEVVELLAA